MPGNIESDIARVILPCILLQPCNKHCYYMVEVMPATFGLWHHYSLSLNPITILNKMLRLLFLSYSTPSYSFILSLYFSDKIAFQISNFKVHTYQCQLFMNWIWSLKLNFISCQMVPICKSLSWSHIYIGLALISNISKMIITYFKSIIVWH